MIQVKINIALKSLAIAGLIGLTSTFAIAEAKIGEPAPSFQAQDAQGKTQKLSDYKGKWVVLEWFNKGCPFVKKHYSSKNMQNLQAKYTQENVIWLTVNSSALGKQGHVDGPTALKDAADLGAKPTAIILDADGKVGKAYGAKTTPHMFVINPEQTLVYAGAIDNNDSANAKTIEGAVNYVAKALDAGMKNQKIEISSTKPYGCSVKYE
jgi:peroxiredoxin